MNSALIVTWTVPIAGREKMALDYAVEVNDYWSKLAADGKCSEPEMFFFSNHGMWMVEGEAGTLRELHEAEQAQQFLTRGQLLLGDFAYELVRTGDAAAQFMLQYAGSAQALGVM